MAETIPLTGDSKPAWIFLIIAVLVLVYAARKGKK